LVLPAIPAEKVTGSALLAGFSGESLRKPVFENLAASGLAGLAGMAVVLPSFAKTHYKMNAPSLGITVNIGY
jgi:hypothetical protein